MDRKYKFVEHSKLLKQEPIWNVCSLLLRRIITFAISIIVMLKTYEALFEEA